MRYRARGGPSWTLPRQPRLGSELKAARDERRDRWEQRRGQLAPPEPPPLLGLLRLARPRLAKGVIDDQEGRLEDEPRLRKAVDALGDNAASRRDKACLLAELAQP